MYAQLRNCSWLWNFEYNHESGHGRTWKNNCFFALKKRLAFPSGCQNSSKQFIFNHNGCQHNQPQKRWSRNESAALTRNCIIFKIWVSKTSQKFCQKLVLLSIYSLSHIIYSNICIKMIFIRSGFFKAASNTGFHQLVSIFSFALWKLFRYKSPIDLSPTVRMTC